MELSSVTGVCNNYALSFNCLVAVTVFDFEMSLSFLLNSSLKIS